MSPGGRNTGSSGSITNVSGGSRAASPSSEPSEASGQRRRLSCSSHSPITLRRYLIVPSMPVSLVKFAARLSRVSTGASSSSPASDQVPEEI